MSGRAERALAACGDYERWASEVARLTAAIRDVECPREAIPEDVDWQTWEQEQSCFRQAKDDEANWRPGGPESPALPPTLPQLAKLVAGCPACSSLCELIAARQHARQRYGVAKRRVRAIGKRAPTPAGETTPAEPSGDDTPGRTTDTEGQHG